MVLKLQHCLQFEIFAKLFHKFHKLRSLNSGLVNFSFVEQKLQLLQVTVYVQVKLCLIYLNLMDRLYTFSV